MVSESCKSSLHRSMSLLHNEDPCHSVVQHAAPRCSDLVSSSSTEDGIEMLITSEERINLAWRW